MRSTYRIDIILAEKFKIFSHKFFANIVSCIFIVFMRIYPFNQNRFPLTKNWLFLISAVLKPTFTAVASRVVLFASLSSMASVYKLGSSADHC